MISMAWTGNRLFQLISELSKSRIKSHLSQMFVPFEMIVLDNALRVTSTRFQHYFAKMKPIINRLLSSVSTDPCEKTLEKILAFKKSLLSFEMRYLTPYCFVSVKLIIRSSSHTILIGSRIIEIDGSTSFYTLRNQQHQPNQQQH